MKVDMTQAQQYKVPKNGLNKPTGCLHGCCQHEVSCNEVFVQIETSQATSLCVAEMYRLLHPAGLCQLLLVGSESASDAHSTQTERAQGPPAAEPAAETDDAPVWTLPPTLPPEQPVLLHAPHTSLHLLEPGVAGLLLLLLLC